MITTDDISTLRHYASAAKEHNCPEEASILMAAVLLLQPSGTDFDKAALKLLCDGKQAILAETAFLQDGIELLIKAMGVKPIKILVEMRGGVLSGVYLSQAPAAVEVEVLDWDNVLDLDGDPDDLAERRWMDKRDAMVQVH